jgi:hypothetical protein
MNIHGLASIIHPDFIHTCNITSERTPQSSREHSYSYTRQHKLDCYRERTATQLLPYLASTETMGAGEGKALYPSRKLLADKRLDLIRPARTSSCMHYQGAFCIAGWVLHLRVSSHSLTSHPRSAALMRARSLSETVQQHESSSHTHQRT